MNRLVAALATFMFVFTTSALAAPGAIWTTDDDCGGVNINLFDYKADVYLNGGPSGGGPGLPDGACCVKVTEPNGTMLGKTLAATAMVVDVHFAQCCQLVNILFTASSGFTSPGYDTTSNYGGEYKV